MFNTKTRNAIAVAGATLGTVVAAGPAQAAVPRPPAVRLQGGATTVTHIRPVGTRNVYLRATTLKRTIKGTLIRTIKGTLIRVTLTRIIIQDGKVVAKISAGATGQGADQATCDRFAGAINSWYDEADDQLATGTVDGVDTALGNAGALEDKALDAGCFIVY